ncbi:hypothetical protein [Nocardia otitidiscaviarum]|uniref:hypothetical protein n=1 Tax=Nocardia otitidiscaviarum TaxID=1823 RepID=UPI0004A75E13|nr:hypothetical protein [Nocardia otitidiscaviarum]
MTDYTPASIEAAILECANRIAKGVGVCNELFQAYQEAETEYVRAYAHARLNADVPLSERKYVADAATIEERERRDVAKAAHKHAEELAQALRNELRALQSVNKSMIGAYSAAGTGQR